MCRGAYSRRSLRSGNDRGRISALADEYLARGLGLGLGWVWTYLRAIAMRRENCSMMVEWGGAPTTQANSSVRDGAEMERRARSERNGRATEWEGNLLPTVELFCEGGYSTKVRSPSRARDLAIGWYWRLLRLLKLLGTLGTLGTLGVVL